MAHSMSFRITVSHVERIWFMVRINKSGLRLVLVRKWPCGVSPVLGGSLAGNTMQSHMAGDAL